MVWTRVDKDKYMGIKGLVASATNRLGILDAYSSVRRWLTRSQVAILIYHRICPKKDKWSLEPLSPDIFETQMKYFTQNYEILSLDELVQSIKSGKSFPKKAIVVTFDDGYKDNYLYAYPVLRKYKIPATIFLTTGYIGASELFWWDKVAYIIENNPSTKRLNLKGLGSYSIQSGPYKTRDILEICEKLTKVSDHKKNSIIEKLLDICQVEIPRDLGKKFILSWKEVKEMDKAGVTFGAHSVNHSILINMPLEQSKNEIVQSKQDIEEKLGKEVTAFSYPNGNFNAEIVELVRKSGFTCAVSYVPGMLPKLISPKDDVYCLARIGTYEDLGRSKMEICGLSEDLARAKRLLLHQTLPY
jgi:peptidoglycan/xylan/chitin deacetylase (PgdA/CDA1 family)